MYLSNNEEHDTFMYFHLEQIPDLKGVGMNNKYIIFFNLGRVWTLDLKTRITSRLSLYISE